MAKATEQTISENYGVAFAPFMDAVCADLDSTVERVKRNAALFVEKVAPEPDAKTTRLVEEIRHYLRGCDRVVQIRNRTMDRTACTGRDYVCLSRGAQKTR
jgi:hypothetical protein